MFGLSKEDVQVICLEQIDKTVSQRLLGEIRAAKAKYEDLHTNSKIQSDRLEKEMRAFCDVLNAWKKEVEDKVNGRLNAIARDVGTLKGFAKDLEYVTSHAKLQASEYQNVAKHRQFAEQAVLAENILKESQILAIGRLAKAVEAIARTSKSLKKEKKSEKLRRK